MKIINHNILIVLKRFKTSYILSVIGLALAYSVFYMTVVQAHFDISFNRNFEKANSIFLYSRIVPGADGSLRLCANTNTIEPRVIAERYPEIINFCFLVWGSHPFEVRDEQAGEIQKRFYLPLTQASIGFIDMFRPVVLFGDIEQAFAPGRVMLTESIAKKMFGSNNPVGEVIFWWGMPLTVGAICADFPDNSSLRNGVFKYEPERSHSIWGYTTYFELAQTNRSRLLQRMNEEQYVQTMIGTPGREHETWQFQLTALSDVHLSAKGEGNLITLIALLSIGILLLVVSYINFFNFSIAMAPIRVKNINIRKILGESPFMLRLSIIMEIVFISLIAFLLSTLIISLFNATTVIFFRADASILENLEVLLFVGAVSVLSGFVAGIYPAFYTTSFNPAMALSGSFSQSQHSKWLRNALISVQFTVAIFLIITTLFVKIQYDYVLSKDRGIQTENVLFFNTEFGRTVVKDFMAELKRNPHIVDVTTGAHFPGQEVMRIYDKPFRDLRVRATIWSVTPNFFDFFGIQVTEGRWVRENEFGKAVLNQTFQRQHGFENDIIGERIFNDNEIIGIVEDFNFHSLHSNIESLVFISTSNLNDYNWVFVKTNGVSTARDIETIQNTWRQFNHTPIEVRSLTTTIQSLYEEERNTANLIFISGIIAIIVAIIGLYGLILLNAKSKRKSIAIRKIHGASATEIIMMLNRNLLVQFAVSYLIAFPLAYYAVRRWLESFAYQTPVHWWVFVLGGFIVLVISLLTVSWESYKAASANPIQGIKYE